MKKQLTLAALAVLTLSGCIVINPSETSTDGTTALQSPSTEAQATMSEVRGLTLDEAYEQTIALPNFSGKVNVKFNPLAGDPTSGDQSSWIVVGSSPSANRKIGDTGVILIAALPGAPAEKAAPLHSVFDLIDAVGSIGIECETDQPPSEAELPDSSTDCLDNLVLSHWTLETEKSKLFFETQKKAYARMTSENPAGSPTLVGPQWMIHGEADIVQKLQTTLGGTII